MVQSKLESELSAQEITRYSRHLVMPEVAMDGQRRLKAARVLIIGAGGLGSPLGLYLAASGIGHIGIIDYDVVDLSNLQRQVLHVTPDIGRLKVDSAAEQLHEINPEIEVKTYNCRISSANALDLIRPYDVIIDGTDNFPTRYLVNDACVLLGKPNIYGSIFRFNGQVSVFSPPAGPCYRCLYPQPPPPGLVPSCAEGGVLGVLPGVIGTLQATETIKLILGIGQSLIGRLLLYDALEMKFREVRVQRDPTCPICGDQPTITKLIDYDQFCGEGGTNKNSRQFEAQYAISVEEVKARIDRGDDIDILDVRSPEEWQICHIDGAKFIPLNELPARVHELSSAREILVYCKTGSRSAKAMAFLREVGFLNVKIIQGGITSWAQNIDTSMPSY